MTGNITLPREVMEQLLKMLEMVEPYADQLTDYSSTAAEWPLNLLPEKVSVAIEALRTHLAAEQPKPEPVAWQERHFFPKVGEWTHWYDCRPRMADYPREQIEQNGVRYQWRPLYAAPPATHPGYVIGSHWLETAYSRVCAGEAEADVLRDIGLVRITDGTVETADIDAIVDHQKALRRDAETSKFHASLYAYLKSRVEHYDGHLCFPEIPCPAPIPDRSPFDAVDAAINAAMGDRT